MVGSIEIDGRAYRFDLSDAIDISIPMRFDGPQPNAYGVEPASSSPCVAGELVGDTRQGGSCNFEQYKLITHCNGTHTECVGHITHERISVRDCLTDVFIPARLISVTPVPPNTTEDTYSVAAESDDALITREAIEKALGDGDNFAALVIRTLPNEESKLEHTYLEDVPPYLTTEAMHFLVERGLTHLLVDTPSIDRLFDRGILANHRLFWEIEHGSFEMTEATRLNATVTELVYVPDSVPDGAYVLNLQIAPFASDAAPSRPLLFPRAG